MTEDLPKISALDSKIFAYLRVDFLNQSMSLNVSLRQVVATKISIVATFRGAGYCRQSRYFCCFKVVFN